MPSPDGGTVAAVVQRSWNDPATFRPYEIAGFDHADIWLIDVVSGEVENVTDGSPDGNGYWNPVWSPDGRTLDVHTVAENLAPESLKWVDRHVLVRGRDRSGGARAGWWLACDRDDGTSGVQRNVTRALPAEPGPAIHDAFDQRMFVIADGELWSVPRSGAAPILLTGDIDERVVRLVPQARASRPGQTFVVTTRDGPRR